MPSTVASPLPPAQTLRVIFHLLPAALSVVSFASRWQAIRPKLIAVKSLLDEISDSPRWSENPLLPTLISSLLSTLHRTQTLCCHCSDASFSGGKLLMQSDLDMASGWLSRHISDLDLLLRSGVLHQSTAIVLSRPDGNSSKDEVAFFVRDLFTRLQIGGLEFKRKALDSLIQFLSEDDKAAAVVAKEGNVSCLISFLDLNSHYSIRELAVVAVSLLVPAGDIPRKCVFEEGALGPLLRNIECFTNTMPVRESAAMAVEFITDDPDNAWAISAYGGVPILIDLCISGSVKAQSHAVGAIRNVSSVEDIRIALAEEGAVPVLIQLLVSGNSSTQGKAADCISILASTNEHFRELMLQERGLQRLLQLFFECSNSDTVEHALRAIYSLSASDIGYRMLSGSTAFIMQIVELVKHGNMILQHISTSLLVNLAISDVTKRAIAGCMGSLMKLMESTKPDGMQEVGAKALLSLLTVKSNQKEFVRDEKSMMRLMQMLDHPTNDVVSKKYAVGVVVAIMAGGSQGCRKKLVAAGAYGHLQRLAELDVPGSKKALHRLSANRLTNILTMAWWE